MGYLTKTDPDPWRSRGQVALEEHDTFTCAHCSTIVKIIDGDVQAHRQRWEVNAKQVTWCKRCSGMICDPCTGFRCDPIEAKIGRFEASGNIADLVGRVR